MANENRLDISEVEIELENAYYLLACFIEFCDDEGDLSNRIPDATEQMSAVCFARRLPQHMPILRRAFDIVGEQHRIMAERCGA